MSVQGQCHCGAIQYEAEVTPGTIAICHCLDCQTLTGSVFRTNIQTLAGTFNITAGVPSKYVKTGETGTKRAHAFCGNCGGPVYSSPLENPETFSLRVGALKQRRELGTPARQIWAKRRAPLLAELDHIPAFDAQAKP